MVIGHEALAARTLAQPLAHRASTLWIDRPVARESLSESRQNLCVGVVKLQIYIIQHASRLENSRCT